MVVYLTDLLEAPWIAICAAALAQASDQLDGWIARKWSYPTLAGYAQDSVADKLFHAGCLLGLGREFPLVPFILWAVLSREFIIMALRMLESEVQLSLKKFKSYSVLYATFLRIGIFCLIGDTCWPSLWAGTLAYVGTAILLLALIAGAVGLISVFQWQSKAVRR
jgi:phosphatidylglycerophosphate synthase